MKSFAVSNIYDIGVYRAIGIKKQSVVLIYLFEMLIISLKTTLVGGLLCFIITNIISSIPIIDVDFAISFGTFSTITFGLIFQTILNLSVVVGLIPVTGVTLPFLSYGGSYNLCVVNFGFCQN